MTSFIQTVENDIIAAWGEIEGAVETGAATVWADFKSTFTALIPHEYEVLKADIVKIVEAGLIGDIAGIETALLNAGGETLALVEKLTSATVQSIIGVVAAAQKPA